MNLPRVCLALLSLSLATVVSAQTAPMMQPGGVKPNPQAGIITIPPAAFEACAGKKPGAVVSWKGMHGNLLQGSCRPYPGGQLVAVPGSLPTGAPPAAASAPRPGTAAPLGGMAGTMMVPPPPKTK